MYLATKLGIPGSASSGAVSQGSKQNLRLKQGQGSPEGPRDHPSMIEKIENDLKFLLHLMHNHINDPSMTFWQIFPLILQSGMHSA